MKADGEPVTIGQYRTLAARVDALGGRLEDYQRKTVRELAGEVAALKRAVALLAARTPRDDGGQPDWLTCRDAAEARRLLTGTWLWVQRAGQPLGLDVTPCWPWHPGGVALLLAACQQYGAVMTGASEQAVTDYLTRYLEAVERRAGHLMRRCDGKRHFTGSVGWAFPDDVAERLPELAAWYALGAEGHPPGLREVEVAEYRRERSRA